MFYEKFRLVMNVPKNAQGPSITVDTACSASLYALTLAFNDIKNGICDAAIVAGTNLILSPWPIEDFAR